MKLYAVSWVQSYTDRGLTAVLAMRNHGRDRRAARGHRRRLARRGVLCWLFTVHVRGCVAHMERDGLR